MLEKIEFARSCAGYGAIILFAISIIFGVFLKWLEVKNKAENLCIVWKVIRDEIISPIIHYAIICWIILLIVPWFFE